MTPVTQSALVPFQYAELRHSCCIWGDTMTNVTRATAKQNKFESYVTSGEVLVGIIWVGLYGMLILSVFPLNPTQLVTAVSAVW